MNTNSEALRTWDGNFYKGSHSPGERKLCVMEVVAYVAGEAHSDHPECACPIISAFLRNWNDSIPDDDLRRELLGQFVFRLPGTKATYEIEVQRSFLCLDWLIRVLMPAFLRLVPSLVCHADALCSCAEVTDFTSLGKMKAAGEAARAAAGEAARASAGEAARAAAWEAAGAAARAAALEAAGAAARAAAWETAGAAAGEAAWAAAWAAAGAATWETAGAAVWAAAGAAVWEAAGAAVWEAAWEAARAAVWEAARAAVWAAAGAAAWEAARAAVWEAARAALRSTVNELQESAVQLVDRMIQLTEPQEATPPGFESLLTHGGNLCS